MPLIAMISFIATTTPWPATSSWGLRVTVSEEPASVMICCEGFSAVDKMSPNAMCKERNAFSSSRLAGCVKCTTNDALRDAFGIAKRVTSVDESLRMPCMLAASKSCASVVVLGFDWTSCHTV